MTDKLKSKIDQLKHGLKLKLNAYAYVAKNPSLYITNYFYSIRNDIDIAAEVLLISS